MLYMFYRSIYNPALFWTGPLDPSTKFVLQRKKAKDCITFSEGMLNEFISLFKEVFPVKGIED